MQEEQITTLDEFIAQQGLTADVERADRNPSMPADDWSRSARHWLVTIRKDLPDTPGCHAGMDVPFSQGSAHMDPPTLADVLDCIASDVATVENACSFDDWADELGYFPMESSADYKRARAAYDAATRQASYLREFLDDEEAFSKLLWDIERL